jgi:hypothetical protein
MNFNDIYYKINRLHELVSDYRVSEHSEQYSNKLFLKRENIINILDDIKIIFLAENAKKKARKHGN